jgi:hypothetical protein
VKTKRFFSVLCAILIVLLLCLSCAGTSRQKNSPAGRTAARSQDRYVPDLTRKINLGDLARYLGLDEGAKATDVEAAIFARAAEAETGRIIILAYSLEDYNTVVRSLEKARLAREVERTAARSEDRSIPDLARKINLGDLARYLGLDEGAEARDVEAALDRVVFARAPVTEKEAQDRRIIYNAYSQEDYNTVVQILEEARVVQEREALLKAEQERQAQQERLAQQEAERQAVVQRAERERQAQQEVERQAAAQRAEQERQAAERKAAEEDEKAAAIASVKEIPAAEMQTAANDDGTLTITRYDGWDKNIAIPARISSKPVTAIGDGAFRNADLTMVVIPGSVKTVGNSAFAGNNLFSLSLGEGLISIGGSAFQGNQLTALVIPDSVKTIEYAAFAGNKLASLDLGRGLESIGDRAFSGNQLTTLVIPDSVKTIGDSFGDYGYEAGYNVSSIAWIRGNNLTSLTMGKGLVSVGKNAFNTGSLERVTLVENYILDGSMFGWKVFYDYMCNGRKAGTYTPERVGSLKEADNFRYIETEYGLVLIGYTGDSHRLVIPEQIGGKPVRYIEGRKGDIDIEAWGLKVGLTGIRIPASVTGIGAYAFYRCSLTVMDIPDSVTYIGISAFANNQLDSVTLPQNLTYIGVSAFAHNQLTSVTLPQSLTYIGKGTFAHNKLESVTLPQGLTSIKEGAFANNQLASITIPNSVTRIEAGAFSGNDSLTFDRGATITIGANVDLGRSCFDEDGYPFPVAYNRNGKKAGVYVLSFYAGGWVGP